jgi:hypothetical protein
LMLATPADGVIANMSLPEIPWSVIRWSPDGRYLYFSGRLYFFDGKHATSIPINFQSDGLWSADSRSLTGYQTQNGQTNLVVYDVEKQHYKTLVADIVTKPVPIGSTQRWLFVRREGKTNWLELMDADGQNRIKLAEVPGDVYRIWQSQPVKDSLQVVIFLTRRTRVVNGPLQGIALSDEPYPVRVIWARLDGSLGRTIHHEFSTNEDFHWLNDHVLLYTQKQHGYVAVTMINAETGVEFPLAAAATTPIYKQTQNQIGLRWRDSNGLQWIDGYTLDGTPIYHIQADRQLADFYPSPDGQLLGLQTWIPGYADNGGYKFELFWTKTHRRINIYAERLDISAVEWKPDSSAVAVVSSSRQGKTTLDVFGSDGQLLQRFTDISFSGYDNQLMWLSCDQLTNTALDQS